MGKYVKDKWYLLNGNWYAKFNQITGKENNTCWAYTESITLNKTYGRHPNAFILLENLKTIELADMTIELADMNEVSKYLPDGHVDKIVNIPEYIECIENKENCEYLIIGRIYKYTEMSGPHYKFICNLKCGSFSIGSSLYGWPEDFKPSSKEAYDQQLKGYNLIKEAKRRYPPDTLFKLAHLNGATGIIRPEYTFRYEKDIIYVCDSGNFNIINDKDGMSYVVYHNGKWSEVINDKTDLLEEAKRRYPIGTKFIPVHRSWNDDNYEESNGIFQLSNEGGYILCKGYSIYHIVGQKWAEIVEDKWIPKVGDKVYDRINKVHRTIINISYLPKSVTLSEQGETYVNQLDYICHEIPNQSLVGRYYQRLNYSINSVQEGDYLRCYAEDNSAVWLDKYGYLNKDDINLHWKLMPEGFKPDYNSKKQYNSFKDIWMDSDKEFYDKYWIIKGIKSKKQLVIGTVQKPILLNKKKNKFQLI